MTLREERRDIENVETDTMPYEDDHDYHERMLILRIEADEKHAEAARARASTAPGVDYGNMQEGPP